MGNAEQFGLPIATATQLREEERFGRIDYRTGLARENLYSRQLTGERLAAYQRGHDQAYLQDPMRFTGASSAG